MEQNKTYSLSKEDYQTLKTTWSKNQRSHDSRDMVIYNLLRDKPAKNGFIEKKKNIQGNDPWFGLRKALANSIYSVSSRYTVLRHRHHGPNMTEEEFKAELKKNLNDRFRNKFGIDLPDFLSVRVTETIKELEDAHAEYLARRNDIVSKELENEYA